MNELLLVENEKLMALIAKQDEGMKALMVQLETQEQRFKVVTQQEIELQKNFLKDSILVTTVE